jgi:hypothetical protein
MRLHASYRCPAKVQVWQEKDEWSNTQDSIKKTRREGSSKGHEWWGKIGLIKCPDQHRCCCLMCFFCCSSQWQTHDLHWTQRQIRGSSQIRVCSPP